MSAGDEQQAWAETVKSLAAARGLRYDPIGGLNPVGQAAALCPGGTNRLTGELSDGLLGRFMRRRRARGGRALLKAVLPGAVLAKSHVPDLAKVMPPFNVESIEKTPEELIMHKASRRKVEFESHRVQQALPGHRPKRVRPGRAAGDCSAPASSSG